MYELPWQVGSDILEALVRFFGDAIDTAWVRAFACDKNLWMCIDGSFSLC